MDAWLIWLIIAAVLVLIELLTYMVASFCLAVGCLFAMAASLIGGGIEWQLGTLIIGTIVAFMVFAPIMRRRHKGTPAYLNSNMDALIGREVRVAEDIPAGGIGRVRIDGDSWQAQSADCREIAAGERVRVLSYDSIILTVEII